MLMILEEMRRIQEVEQGKSKNISENAYKFNFGKIRLNPDVLDNLQKPFVFGVNDVKLANK